MTMTMYCALRAVGSPSDGPSAPKKCVVFNGESIGNDDESWSFAQSPRIIFILLSGRILTLF